MSRPLNRLSCALFAAALMAVAATGAGAHPADVTDVDHDNFKNWADNCIKNYNPKQTDTDGDTPDPVAETGQSTPQTGPITVYPHTPVDPNGQSTPTDQDPEVGGDACDIDDDADKIYDKKQAGKPGPDNCRLKANAQQEDADSDGRGDVCDDDDDNDTVLDSADNCAVISNSDQANHDKDALGDACDPDAPKRAASGLLSGFDPNDKKAPTIALRRLSLLRFAELGRGIAVGVTCSEGCILEGELVLDGRVARKLKVGKSSAKTVVVGRGAAQIAEKGKTYVFVKFSKAILARLQRAANVKTVLRLTALDASGNKSSTSKRLQLRR